MSSNIPDFASLIEEIMEITTNFHEETDLELFFLISTRSRCTL